MFKKTLVIAPHADDEVLGCGGFIYKHTHSGQMVDVAVCALGGVHHTHLKTPASYEQRYRELEKSCTILGCNLLDVLFPNMDMRLDSVAMVDFVSKLDAILSAGSYHFVLVPYPSLNHDHRLVFDAAWSALRPTNKLSVKAVACYEYAYVQHQPAHSLSPSGGKLYYPLTSQAYHAKIEALRCYTSQIRPLPAPTNEAAVESLAKFRALECRTSGTEYAELFYLQKMVW